MKFEVEVECTPVEARTFIGLPDLTPLHEAWIDKMKSLSTEGPSVEDWNKLMTTWSKGLPGMTEGFDAWQKMMLTASGMTPKTENKG
jgi:hypothetical protein